MTRSNLRQEELSVRLLTREFDGERFALDSVHRHRVYPLYNLLFTSHQ